MTQNIEGNKT